MNLSKRIIPFLKKILLPSVVFVFVFFLILGIREPNVFGHNLLSKTPLLHFLVKSNEHLAKKKEVVELNFYIPDFSGVQKVIKGESITKQEMEMYELYYNKVKEVFPTEAAGANTVLGALYFSQNRFEEAAKCFVSAFEENPQNFWHLYNLAVMIGRSDQNQGLVLLKAALGSPVENTKKSLYTSKVYVQIMGSPGFNYSVKDSFQKTYAQVLHILQQSPSHIRQLQVKIF